MQKRQQGFTLVELIVVIILLGILGVTATSRLIGKSSFTAHIARDQAISIARQMQITAMQSELLNKTDFDALGTDHKVVISCRQLVASQGGVRFGVPANISVDGQNKLCGDSSSRSDVITLTDSSIKTVIGNFPLHFDLLGRPITLNAQREASRACEDRGGCRVTFGSGNEVASLCISKEGYINDCS
ncbi:prepilin-type N-terminal cleavage/methylation domain-containing protein [Photobacterium lipolyticum]|uniref:MSHA biogenesis protein MshC n=1 Tax=Photobacterium lipolyticum TaxID=266810 RepID=A0A2T3MXD4_9GAMM|nr:type II secretion system protein [Photobacterium lipolyticum]PSW04553.1 hypothetical protein C9I89_12180 [Photobacterium lipolyticum]